MVEKLPNIPSGWVKSNYVFLFFTFLYQSPYFSAILCNIFYQGSDKRCSRDTKRGYSIEPLSFELGAIIPATSLIRSTPPPPRYMNVCKMQKISYENENENVFSCEKRIYVRIWAILRQIFPEKLISPVGAGGGGGGGVLFRTRENVRDSTHPNRPRV